MAQEIEVKVKVVTEQAVNNVDALGNAFDATAKDAQDAQKVFAKAGNGVVVEESIAGLKQLKRELKNVAVGSEEFKKLYNDIDDLEDKLKSAKNTSSDWVDSLESAGGPLGMLGQGINKVKVATQTFGGALKATGIGLVVALLAGLAGAFANNEGAMKKLQPLLDGVSKLFQGVFRAVEPLFNTLVDLAVSALPMVSKAFSVVYSTMTATLQSFGAIGAAIGKLIKGDFSGAWETAKSSVNDFGKNYDASLKRFEAGAKELTKTEKLSADERQKIRDKEIADKVIRDEKEKARREKLAEEEKAKSDALRTGYEKARDDLENHEKAVAELNKKYDEEKAIRLADTAVKKEELDYEKRVLEIENLATNELERQTLIEKLDGEHKVRLGVAQKTDNDKNLADEKKLADEKLAIKYKALNDLQTIFGAESTMGKALLVAKQMLMAKELIMEVSKTITFSAQAAARSTVALAEGAAQTAKIGFPQNIPLLIGYAAQAVGIFSAIKGAVSASKASGVSMPSMSIPSSGGGIVTPTTIQASPSVVAPSGVNQLASTLGQNVPIKTYVVSKEMTTQAALDRAIEDTASLG